MNANNRNTQQSRLGLLAAILLIALSIIVSVVLTSVLKDTNDSFLSSLYYSSQIIAAIFVISGVVIAVWQYVLSLRNSRTNWDVIRVQRAIELSEYYKDNILNYYPAIQYVFDKCGLSEIINSIRIDDIHDFDINECHRLFSADQIEKLRQIQTTKKFVQGVLEANEIYNLGLHMPGLTVSKETSDDGTESVMIKVDAITVVRAFLTEVKNKSLNNLEYFAMHFNHNVADDSVIYQSLHQTYLGFVHLLYYSIATLNSDATEKYYTNVIWLFEEWKGKKNKQIQEQSKKAETVISHGTRVGG